MNKYTIRYNYNAHIDVVVYANDEGEALALGREKAEDADINEYTIFGERESQILRQE